MATTATNVYWSLECRQMDVLTITGMPQYRGEGVAFTSSVVDPPHECDVIQRLSEAYRAFIK